jgi:hypothetical protein
MNGPATIQTASKTAILVTNSALGPILCPFFGKCDGVLLIDETGAAGEFHPHDRSDAKSLCKLILTLKPSTLICGFIGAKEKQRLWKTGIDVRLGSCSLSINELFATCHNLPRA